MNKNSKTNLSIALIIIILPVIILLAPIIIFYNKTGSNTFVLDKNYSHLSREQVLDRLNQDFVLPSEVKFKTDNLNFSLNLSSISAQIDINKVANSILYRRLNEGIFAYIKYFFRHKEFLLSISFDQNKLDQEVATLAEQIDQPFIPTEIEFKNNKLIINEGSLGKELDQDALKLEIISKLTLGLFDQEIYLQPQTVGYLPTQDQLDQAKSVAQKLIGKSLLLKTDTNTVVIDDQTLISWVDFQSDYKEEKIQEYSDNLSKSLEREPINAIFRFDHGQVLEFQPSKDGIIPDAEKLTGLILDGLGKLVTSEDSSSEINIPVTTIQPVVKTDDVNNLGIKELLGKGTSTFKHSAATRNENITKGSSIINRILVAPDETFSFIKNLGEVSLEAGYKKAYIIRQGKTELDVGGGVCQVSTTLFRAMLDAGLDITERKAHAYRVSYYEEDSKPGFDATVFIPNPDLKFVNDTGHYVLIQSVLDMENRRLTYEIYGTSDGRKVKIDNYRQWGAQPAPPDVWIDDPTLPAGKVVQDEHAIPGLKTAFDWTVTDKDGNIIHQKTFTSNFVPWAAVYRRGTGQ